MWKKERGARKYAREMFVVRVSENASQQNKQTAERLIGLHKQLDSAEPYMSFTATQYRNWKSDGQDEDWHYRG